MELKIDNCKKIAQLTAFTERMVREAHASYCQQLNIAISPAVVALSMCGCDFVENVRGRANTDVRDNIHEIVVSITQSVAEMLSTLGHEMVHVAQHIRGDSVNHEDGMVWRGKHYPGKQVLRAQRSGNARSLPWEAEAYERQDALFATFISSLPPDDLRLLLAEDRVKMVPPDLGEILDMLKGKLAKFKIPQSAKETVPTASSQG